MTKQRAERRVVVTGGAGFIGSHLCARLLERGDEVLCLDNFQTGTRDFIRALQDHPGFELVERDIVEPWSFDCDAVFNLACPASPIHYQRDPVHTLKTSVMGALHALEVGRRQSVPVLQASTSEVYGDPEVHPQTEGYWGNVNPIGPRACYDEGKRCAETLFMDYQRQHGVPVKIARIFNTYGPHLQAGDGRVVSNFIVQALTEQPITIYGQGLQTRSLCYVDDTVAGLLKLMDSPPAVSGPINLGNPVEMNMIDIAELILELTGSGSQLVYRPLPVDDPRQRCPDIGRAKAQLDWAPAVTPREGLARTIAWFDAHLRQSGQAVVRQAAGLPIV